MTMPAYAPPRRAAGPSGDPATTRSTAQLQLDLHHVLETAIDQVIAFVGAERGFILLVDIETSKFVGEAVQDRSPGS